MVFTNPFRSSSSSSSFSYPGSIPHMLRHGMASMDPRHEYNRSFHQLSGKIKALRIDYDSMAREARGVATATCRWGQDQLPEKREDGAGDEAVADMADRLAYIFSLIGDLHADHSKRVEESRVDLKRIQKAESELAPKRAARVKIHKELMTLLPERAKVNSTKIAPLEAQLEGLEADDKALEEELGKLKREALKSSYDSHFDSMIELGEKMALLARYGKLINAQLPIYAPPFPTPRHLARKANEEVWQGESKIAAIRAAVEPAMQALKPDVSLPDMPNLSISTLTKRQTVRYGESHKKELEKAIKEEEEGFGSLDSQDSELQDYKDSPPILPMGGSLPPNLNLGPSPLPVGSSIAATSSPDQPSHRTHGGDAGPTHSLSPSHESPYNPASAGIVEGGPTYAETGSPIMSSHTGPGPKTGTLSPRVKSPTSARTEPDVKTPTPQSYFASSKEEKAAQEQREVASSAVAARIRRDGTIVRRGDSDWKEAEGEGLPPYQD